MSVTQGAARGSVDRREMLRALAHWTIPTVATFALGARALQAQVSCPPCERLSGGRCKPCNNPQITSCQCEPCLGPPSCPAGPVAPAAPGGQPLQSQNQQDAGQSKAAMLKAIRDRQRAWQDPLRQPLYSDPFDLQKTRFTPERSGTPSLFDRLRGDSTRTAWPRP